MRKYPCLPTGLQARMAVLLVTATFWQYHLRKRKIADPFATLDIQQECPSTITQALLPPPPSIARSLLSLRGKVAVRLSAAAGTEIVLGDVACQALPRRLEDSLLLDAAILCQSWLDCRVTVPTRLGSHLHVRTGDTLAILFP